mmetsp:Transcript_18113/g.15806  ORF Transcript_18113/g.15806 Transcript_18113/m.15806 type:complete len:121 (-) Transcript_18113:400-762(-)
MARIALDEVLQEKDNLLSLIDYFKNMIHKEKNQKMEAEKNIDKLRSTSYNLHQKNTNLDERNLKTEMLLGRAKKEVGTLHGEVTKLRKNLDYCDEKFGEETNLISYHKDRIEEIKYQLHQ